MPKTDRKNWQERDALLNRATKASEFSELTYLLRVVTALNPHNELPSAFTEYRHQRREVTNTTSDVANLNFTVLDSIATILVQEHEVVAACFATDSKSVVVAETDPQLSIDTNDSDAPAEPLPPSSHDVYPLRLATVSNPDFNSSNDGESNLNTNVHGLRIQPEGENLWTKVWDVNKWYCVLM